jgi:L-amino acid N-acyltransferase YncA
MCSKPVIRPSLSRDIPDITTIYAMHVREGVASFELTPPSETEILNVAPTKPWSPCKPHTVRQPRNQAAARACRSSS